MQAASSGTVPDDGQHHAEVVEAGNYNDGVSLSPVLSDDAVASGGSATVNLSRVWSAPSTLYKPWSKHFVEVFQFTGVGGGSWYDLRSRKITTVVPSCFSDVFCKLLFIHNSASVSSFQKGWKDKGTRKRLGETGEGWGDLLQGSGEIDAPVCDTDADSVYLLMFSPYLLLSDSDSSNWCRLPGLLFNSDCVNTIYVQLCVSNWLLLQLSRVVAYYCRCVARWHPLVCVWQFANSVIFIIVVIRLPGNVSYPWRSCVLLLMFFFWH